MIWIVSSPSPPSEVLLHVFLFTVGHQPRSWGHNGPFILCGSWKDTVCSATCYRKTKRTENNKVPPNYKWVSEDYKRVECSDNWNHQAVRKQGSILWVNGFIVAALKYPINCCSAVVVMTWQSFIKVSSYSWKVLLRITVIFWKYWLVETVREDG